MKSTRKPITWKKNLLPFVAALVLSGARMAGALDYTGTILADHPRAYYRLEETSGTTAVDSSASGLFPGNYITSGAFPFLGWPGIETNAIAVSAGAGYSCAILASGSVRCWGDNKSGELGDGTTTNSSVPVTVVGF